MIESTAAHRVRAIKLFNEKACELSLNVCYSWNAASGLCLKRMRSTKKLTEMTLGVEGQTVGEFKLDSD